MNAQFVQFDAVFDLVIDTLDMLGNIPKDATPVYLVRDLFGKVRISVSEDVRSHEPSTNALQTLAQMLHDALGAHGYPARDGVLFVDPELLHTLDDVAQEIRPGVYWADRLVTGHDWWTVGDALPERQAMRCTLYSIKGGVGRSTTAAVLAWHLARNGERVLIVDLDLESPGLTSAILDRELQPDFGVTDWFVEDLVGQGDHVAERMTAAPSWSHDLRGDVRVASAHGSEPGDYLAKLGRVYMDTDQSWTTRLARLLDGLEADFEPTLVLLESRSGLHDIAAATVTDLGAEVLLFATDSESTWSGYDMLFRHWQLRQLAGRIGERLSIVSALTPELDTEKYLEKFRETAFYLFQLRLYEQLDPNADPEGDFFSYDINDEHAPHNPLPIHWTRGLAAGTSLRNLERTTVGQAYSQFLDRFDELIRTSRAYRQSSTGFDADGHDGNNGDSR